MVPSSVRLALVGFGVVAGVVAGAMSGCGSTTQPAGDERADARLDEPPDSALDASLDAVVFIRADRCRAVPDRGVGILVEPGLVLTAAHVVAGATRIAVVHGSSEMEGRIVGFDPESDIAALEVPIDDVSPVPLADPEVDTDLVGRTGTAIVLRDGVATEIEVVLERPVVIISEDIYRGGRHRRPGYEARARIEPGDSGAAVVVDDRVVGMLWSRSREAADRAWVIDTPRAAGHVLEQVRAGSLDPSVDITRC